jgi:hypothetical protein
MADEVDLLRALGMDASECIKVDLYWAHRDDVLFLQVQTAAYARERGPGYYVRRAPSGYVNVVVVVDDEQVSSSVIERALREIAKRKIAVKGLDSHLRRLT